MSKLDDILISNKVSNPLIDGPFEDDDLEYLEFKQQIKELFLGLVGNDDDIPNDNYTVEETEGRNSLREGLRQEICEL